MLIVGTRAHLEDLDRSYTYAEDVAVTSLAVGTFFGGVGSLLPGGPRPTWALLDAERIVSLEEFDVAPLVRLPVAAQDAWPRCRRAPSWWASRTPTSSRCPKAGSSPRSPASTRSREGTPGPTPLDHLPTCAPWRAQSRAGLSACTSAASGAPPIKVPAGNA